MSIKATKHVLSNGLRAIFIPRLESPVVNVMVTTETGSEHEAKSENGLSHFLEHMLFKGTEKRAGSSDISIEFDALGANFNAFTSYQYTGYYATVTPRHGERALALLADMYLNSTFPEKEIAKERGVIIEEINMYEDLPHRQVGQVFSSLVYGDQPAGRNILGTKETVSSFRQSDFLAYRDRHYVAPKTIVVVAGKFDERKMLRRLAREFGAMGAGERLAKPPVAEVQSTPGLSLKLKASDQSHLLLGFRGYAASDRRYAAVELLTAVLGGGMSSRLFRKIRDEMGAAYYVRANNDAYADRGLMEVAVGSDTSRLLPVVKAILVECDRLRSEVVPRAELERVKESVVGSIHLSLETAGGLTSHYLQEEINHGRLTTPEALIRALRRVTAAEIRKVAREIFTNERLNLAVVGPTKEAEPLVAALRL